MLEMLFNRWRGTGTIFWKINGNTIYAIYWALLVGFVSGLWYIGLLFGALYILGESFAWGKWVGYVSSDDRNKIILDDFFYENDDGRSFPWIHFIANYFIDQKKDYLNYCRLALGIRGLFWWILPLSLLFFMDLIVLWQYIYGLVLLSTGFVIAAELSRFVNIELRSRWLNLSIGWENQEVIYGLFHFLGITLMLFI